MATFRSGAGGKIVTNRRKQRLAATPYDRPLPEPSRPPLPKSPNWFSGVIVPSARALASGAGRILSSIFSESESSSEDEDSASEDDVQNDNHYGSPYDGVNKSNEKNVTSPELMQYGQESQLSVRRTETKQIIEQLIMRETFSREECDKLIQVLNSRVMGGSTEAGERILLAGSLGKTLDHEHVDIYNQAVQEAKKWFKEKKVGSSSVTELAPGNLNSTGVDYIESGGGSPVDLARSYMKDRPPWASPTRNIELRTPLTTAMKHFKEEHCIQLAKIFCLHQRIGYWKFLTAHDLPIDLKRNSLASGSWNIQEELRRVRSKATEDLLRTPSSKIDPSLFAVTPSRENSVGAGNLFFALGERMTEPESLVDAGVSSDPALAALESRQAGKASEAVSSKPATSVSGNNEDAEAVQASSRSPHSSSANHAEEHHTDSCLIKTNGPPATELAEFGGKQNVNGPSSSQASLSAGVDTSGLGSEQNYKHDEENHNADTVNEKKPVNVVNVEGNCELLSEAYMEVPIVTETDSIASGSQNSLAMQHEELSQDMAQPSRNEKVDSTAGKQQGGKLGKYKTRQRKRHGSSRTTSWQPTHIFFYDEAAQAKFQQEKPWANDPHYFKRVKISALALLKMVVHARSGGTIEVMGLMQGKTDGDAIIVMDAFALPVEETAYEFSCVGGVSCLKVQAGRLENVVGWYHSHPGYGCWLSGIDVSTQMLKQYQEPFLAVVVDPTRTVSAGK
ncbi:COP9 signalosome complex subunitb [Sesamum angolense]|uniref:COP9 signalosome complex subunit 5 n=1 Tax=Sesamum angolense TaxID=2727404 RepID=A0AAE1W949_9LAMI|nr:COP9 signalosome complex subunitb [Sesamum angolense]